MNQFFKLMAQFEKIVHLGELKKFGGAPKWSAFSPLEPASVAVGIGRIGGIARLGGSPALIGKVMYSSLFWLSI
jgi:hypothetical protein